MQIDNRNQLLASQVESNVAQVSADLRRAHQDPVATGAARASGE